MIMRLTALPPPPARITGYRLSCSAHPIDIRRRACRHDSSNLRTSDADDLDLSISTNRHVNRAMRYCTSTSASPASCWAVLQCVQSGHRGH